MKTLMKALAFFFAVLVLGAASVTAQTVTFFSVSAPIESTAASAFRSNVANALKNGVASWGTPGTPGYFDASDSHIAVADIVSTPNFSSWNGYADPGTVFGPAFSAQIGNAYRNPFLITKGVTQFSLSQVTGTTVIDGLSSHSSNLPLVNYNSSTVIGIRFGANGILGGGDDTYVTSGVTTQLVDALIYNATSTTFTVSSIGLTEQDQLNSTFGSLNGLKITTAVSLNGVQIGQYTQVFDSSPPVATAIPEPATVAALVGLCALGLVVLRKRGRRPGSA